MTVCFPKSGDRNEMEDEAGDREQSEEFDPRRLWSLLRSVEERLYFVLVYEGISDCCVGLVTTFKYCPLDPLELEVSSAELEVTLVDLGDNLVSLEVTSLDFGIVPVEVRILPEVGGVSPVDIFLLAFVIVAGPVTIVLGMLAGNLGLGVLTLELGISPLFIFN